MKYIITIATIFIFSCNRSSQETSSCFQYPSQIKKLKIKDLYDTARWVIYNWQSDKKNRGIYYGHMELRFEEVLTRNDSLEIFFQFYPQDSLINKRGNRDPVAWASVAFRKNKKEKLWAYMYPYDYFSSAIQQGVKDFDAPLSARALQFIKTHRDSLHDCYRELAIKMKVVEK